MGARKGRGMLKIWKKRKTDPPELLTLFQARNAHPTRSQASNPVRGYKRSTILEVRNAITTATTKTTAATNTTAATSKMTKRSTTTSVGFQVASTQTSFYDLPEAYGDLDMYRDDASHPMDHHHHHHQQHVIAGDDDDLFQKSLPLNMQFTLVRINRTMPQGFFTSRDRNLANQVNDPLTVRPKGPIAPPLSQHDQEVLKKKQSSKAKQVPLEIDPEYQRVVPEAYVNQLMPLTGQYQASEPGLIEIERLMAEHGALFPAQLDLETQAANLEICRSMASKDNVTALGRGSEMGPARSLMRQWYHPLLSALKAKIAHELTRTKTTQLMNAISHLRPEFLAAITLHAAIGHTLSHSEGAQFISLCMSVAETVQAQINYDLLKQHNPKFLEARYGPKAVYSQQVIQKLSKRMLQTPESPELSDATVRKLASSSSSLSSSSSSSAAESILSGASSSSGFSSGDIDTSQSGFSSMRINPQDLDTSLNRLQATDNPDASLSAAMRSSASFQPRHSDSTLKYDRSRAYLSPAELNAPHAKLWSKQLKSDVGKFLLSTLVEVATFTHVTENGVKQEKQAFEVEAPKTTASDMFAFRTIRLADAIMENISYEHVLQEANHIRHYPMLVPPRPWTGPEDGGYFLYPASVLRYYSYEQQMRPLYENQDQLSLLYESLSALGETSWRINKDVYNVIKQAWSEGGSVADIPSRSDLPLPVPGPEGKNPAWYKQLQRIQTENYNKNSLRCDLLLKLLVVRITPIPSFWFLGSFGFSSSSEWAAHS